MLSFQGSKVDEIPIPDKVLFKGDRGMVPLFICYNTSQIRNNFFQSILYFESTLFEYLRITILKAGSTAAALYLGTYSDVQNCYLCQ